MNNPSPIPLPCRPAVTFVMPAYNAAPYIDEAIGSIVAQSFVDWELIVVDDHSTDDTAMRAREWARREPRVRVLQTERQTGAAFIPRKTAIEAAGSDLICCVDADDRIAPDFMQRLMRRRLETGADIVYPSMWKFDNTTSQRLLPLDTGLYDKAIAGRDVVSLTLDGWKINTAGALKERRLYLSLYERMPDCANHTFADELLTRYLIYDARLVAFSDAAYYYRANTGSVTRKVSVKQFHYLLSNLTLISFTRERYGVGSEEYALAQKLNFLGYYSALLMLEEGKLPEAEAAEARRLTVRAREAIDYNSIKDRISWRFRLTHMLPEKAFVLLRKLRRT